MKILRFETEHQKMFYYLKAFAFSLFLGEQYLYLLAGELTVFFPCRWNFMLLLQHINRIIVNDYTYHFTKKQIQKDILI
jgi:hypothetical protein